MLLTDRQCAMKRFYRLPLDYIEEMSTGWASKILVNSQFTAGVFRQTFRSLQHLQPEVVYPVPNAASLTLPDVVTRAAPQASPPAADNRKVCRKLLPGGSLPPTARVLFVSINRYERKKNIRLGLYAIAYLVNNWSELIPSTCTTRPEEVHFIHAGGYDTRVKENVEHHDELVALAKELKITNQVTFIRSCPSEVKTLLIASSDAVVYTPEGEHFGIVPVEAMFLGRPVVALNSGGPCETVGHGTTGFLCPVEPKALLPEAMATHLARFINEPSLVTRLGRAGRSKALEKFSLTSFRRQLCNIVSNL